MNLLTFLLKRFMFRYWFCLNIIFATIIAEIFPGIGVEEGFLRPEITTPYLVASIYFISGWSLDSRHFWRQLYNYKGHLYTQFFALIINPMFLSLVCCVLRFFNIDFWTLKGMFILASMPPPTTIPVALTYASSGNHAFAIINTILATILSTITSPIMVFLMLGSTALVPANKLRDLLNQVIVPLVLGQIIRRATFNLSKKINSRYLANFFLVIVTILTFHLLCQVFANSESDLRASHVLLSVLFAIGSQIFMTIMIMKIPICFNTDFSLRDLMAIVYCSTFKTFDLGEIILKILFQGYSHLCLLTLPLIVYQPIQLIFGGILINYFQDQLKKSYQRKNIQTEERLQSNLLPKYSPGVTISHIDSMETMTHIFTYSF